MNRVEVEILGNIYNLRADGSVDYIKKIAEYLNKKINEVAKESTAATSTDLSLLAALNITDELFKLRENVDQNYRSLFEETNSLVEHIEKLDY